MILGHLNLFDSREENNIDDDLKFWNWR